MTFLNAISEAINGVASSKYGAFEYRVPGAPELTIYARQIDGGKFKLRYFVGSKEVGKQEFKSSLEGGKYAR